MLYWITFHWNSQGLSKSFVPDPFYKLAKSDNSTPMSVVYKQSALEGPCAQNAQHQAHFQGLACITPVYLSLPLYSPVYPSALFCPGELMYVEP